LDVANSEKRAGVSIYFEEIDAGDLCAQRSFPVYPTIRSTRS
jgi:hypothetical protein